MHLSSLLLRSWLLCCLTAGTGSATDRPEAVEREAQRHLLARVHQMGLGEHHGFATKNVHVDESGEAHVRMHQFYRGVRIFEGEAIAHLKGGQVRGLTDALVRGLHANPSPSLQPSEALAGAWAIVKAKGPFLAQPRTELVFARPEGLDHHVLAFHVHVEQKGGDTDFLVDAHSGRVLESWDSSARGAAEGTGLSQYNGIVTLNTNAVPGGYELRDTTRGIGGNATYDQAHVGTGFGTQDGLGAIYQDADNTWGDGQNYIEGAGELGSASANGQTAAVDAHYGLQVTWDYLLKVHGRASVDGLGTAIYNRVHHGNEFPNAFWRSSCMCMTYGDGSSTPTLTTLDITAHEIGHGVSDFTAGFVSRGETHGLYEGSPDIFGAMVEFYRYGAGGSGAVVPDTGGNWTLGEGLGTVLRTMYKPSLDGQSVDAWYKGVGKLDGHFSNGIVNHFFFLAAHGSQADALCDFAQSPMANGVTGITGLGNQKAARIWYRALSAYLTSHATFANARTATLRAASDLFGAGSVEFATVDKAWLAVNVK